MMRNQAVRVVLGCVVICLLLFISLYSPSFRKLRGRSLPYTEKPERLPALIHNIPSDIGFSLGQVCILNGKVYASSNVGLLEVENGQLLRIFKWSSDDDVIESPSVNRASNSLWAVHYGLDKIVRFDGVKWALLDIPVPEDGYTRGDYLSGFRFVDSPEGFWLDTNKVWWRWSGAESRWVLDTDLISSLPGRDWLKSDVTVALGGGVFYILDKKSGTLQEISATSRTEIRGPAFCEAIASSSRHTLWAIFRGKGIFEYRDGWQEITALPFWHQNPNILLISMNRMDRSQSRSAQRRMQMMARITVRPQYGFLKELDIEK